MRTVTKTSTLLAFLATVAAHRSVAAGDAKAETKACLAASDQAQQLKDERKLVKAREQALACSKDSCPGPVRKDCLQWLQTIDASLPSIVINARDGGKDITNVT